MSPADRGNMGLVRARVLAVAVAGTLLVSACGLQITEEEARQTGESAGIALDAFVDVFQQRVDAAKAEAQTMFTTSSTTPLFTTTVPPADGVATFDPQFDCVWTGQVAWDGPGVSFSVPGFARVDLATSGGTWTATFDYGECAPLSGRVVVLAPTIDAGGVVGSALLSTTVPSPPDLDLAIDTLLAGWATEPGYSVVTDGPVAVPGSLAPGRLVEVDTDTVRRVMLGIVETDASLVIVVVEADRGRWAELAPLVLDYLRSLAVR